MACILAEEFGHHYTSFGDIIDLSDPSNRKQEHRARLWVMKNEFSPYHDNIICLPGQPGGRAAIPFRVLREGVVLMSTYEELIVILTVGLLIVAILNLKNK